MNRKFARNLMVAVLGIGLLYGATMLRTYAKEYMDTNFKLSVWGTVVGMIIPILFGVVISLKTKEGNKGPRKIDWPKLIIQGLPAFLLGIPWNNVIFAAMELLHIQNLDLGIFNNLMVQLAIYQSKISSIAGVWLGKVLLESFYYGQELKDHQDTSTFEVKTM